MALDRKDVPAKYKWDLTVIYKTEADFNADLKLAEQMAKDYAKHEKTMTTSATALYEALRDMATLIEKLERLWQYASLHFATDSTNNAYQAMNARVRNLSVMIGQTTWFVSPYLIKLDSAVVSSWFAVEPRLESFRRMIEKSQAEKKHTLSDECEKLMTKVSDALGSNSQVRSIFANSDLQFGKIKDESGKMVQIEDASYVTMLMSPDRRVRQSAFRTLYKTYEQFGNTFATLFASHIKERCAMAKVRNFKDSITASTFNDEVDPTIYNNLIKSVHKGLPALYDYYDLKREVLGLDKLHMYDLYAPLIGELDKKYTYEEAVDEVIKTAEIFGEEYHSTLKAGLTEKGWVDVYPARGKRGGAFSSGCPGTEPYILMNYTETFNDVSTLAHEAGHSMHTYFSNTYNEPHNAGYTIFVAEVASTVNELLMAHRKLEESKSNEEKLYILNQLIETYKGTLYRQTMFAEFERDMHAMTEKGTPLTADVINTHYKKLVRKYFGPNVAIDRQIAFEWMRIPHFYTSFYVYKYATCISAASAIVKRIETEGASYVNQYIDFLKCGDSKSPLDSLKVAGIDMTSPEVINGAIEDFASCVRQFREIYNNK